jgi:D-alanyl-D-alanine carboxypeptidase/D-alanyl-D-alanine-endopeptidase (penicillin-binding protein 4)
VPVWGDPLRVMKELASGVLMKGVARVRGRVLVEATLFPSTQLEPATHTVISPVMLNDNVVDVTATSSTVVGEPAEVTLSPNLPYLHLVNHVTTGVAEAESELQFASDVTEGDGSHTVVLEGHVPAGRQHALAAYKVHEPVLYAQMGFQQALEWAGIKVQAPAKTADEPAGQRTLLVEHLSPPLKEEVRLTLKVSQNLHAATMPWLIGSLVPQSAQALQANAHRDAAQRGMALERRWLAEAGLAPETVSQLDGEGGVGSAFSPEFMVRYLEFLSRQPYGPILFNALPVLGRDGTLTELLKDSAAAGQVHAKTGSYSVANNLDSGVMLLGKGLVGYIDAANHHRLIFAAYASLLPLRSMDEVAEVTHTLAEMSAAAYEFAPGKPLPEAKATVAAKLTPAKGNPAAKASPPLSPIAVIVSAPSARPALAGKGQTKAAQKAAAKPAQPPKQDAMLRLPLPSARPLVIPMHIILRAPAVLPVLAPGAVNPTPPPSPRAVPKAKQAKAAAKAKAPAAKKSAPAKPKAAATRAKPSADAAQQ